MIPRFPKLAPLLPALLVALLAGACNPDPAKPSPTAPPTAGVRGQEEIPLGTVIAVVNGEPIKERQVVEEAEPLLINLGLSPGTAAWNRALEERRGPILDTVITRKLILQHARDAKIVIPNEPEKLEAALAQFKRSFASDEAYQNFLYEQEMSEKDLRDRLLWEMKSVEFLRQKQEEKPAVVTQEEVTAYYVEHPEYFRDRVRLQVVAIYVDKGATPAEREEKRGLAELAKARLEGGAEFERVAREFSDDPAAQETGGDLGFVSPNDADPVIARAITGVPEGTILGPLESGLGYYIVRVGRRGQTLADDNLREALQRELVEKKRAENIRDWMEMVKRSSRTRIDLVHPRYQRLFPSGVQLPPAP